MNLKKNLSTKILFAGLLLLASGYCSVQAILPEIYRYSPGRIALCMRTRIHSMGQTYEQARQTCMEWRYRHFDVRGLWSRSTPADRAQIIREIGVHLVPWKVIRQEQQNALIEKILRGEPLE